MCSYYRARYYEPNLGRFVTEDPLRFLAGPNFLAYVYNNPANSYDPLGLDPPAKPSWIETKYGWLRNGGFIYYGNWGGPGWTGAQLTPYEDLSKEDQDRLPIPIDEQDACYKEHDLCYSRARVGNNCTSKDHPSNEQRTSVSREFGGCDIALMMCLQDVNSRDGKGNNAYSHAAVPVFSLQQLIFH